MCREVLTCELSLHAQSSRLNRPGNKNKACVAGEEKLQLLYVLYLAVRAVRAVRLIGQ